MTATVKRTERIGLSVTPGEKQTLALVATLADTTVSGLVYQLVQQATPALDAILMAAADAEQPIRRMHEELGKLLREASVAVDDVGALTPLTNKGGQHEG
jgi:hypothetical protein